MSNKMTVVHTHTQNEKLHFIAKRLTHVYCTQYNRTPIIRTLVKPDAG